MMFGSSLRGRVRRVAPSLVAARLEAARPPSRAAVLVRVSAAFDASIFDKEDVHVVVVVLIDVGNICRFFQNVS